MKKIILILLVLLGLQTQAQTSSAPYFCCDSITYWTDQSQGFNVGLDTSGIIHNPDSMSILWQVCNSNMCYAGDGMYAYFGQILTTDTVKVCYDVMIYESGVLEVCTRCDWLTFDQNSYTWILYNVGNPTAVKQVEFNIVNNGKIYDLLGRELVEIPVGEMYIRNRMLYISK